MKRNLYLSKCLCVVILAVCMSALPGITGASFANEPIKVGFIGALSTPYGASNKAALEISIEEINAAGGILGRPVELVTQDWKREVTLAVAAYKKLVMQDKCIAVFTEGTEGTTACAQVGARLFSKYPHLQIAFWTAHEGITDLVANEYDKYKFLFRPYTNTGDVYNPVLENVGFLKDTVGVKKLALLIEDIGWTETFRKGKSGVFPTVKEYYEKNGIEIVYYGITDIKEKMFLPILEKIAASGADAIMWETGYTDTVTLVKQWSQSSAKDIDLILESGASGYAAFWGMTGGQALGVCSNWPQIAIPFTEKSLPFLKKLKEKKAGMLASTYAAYDGPWIIKAAAEKVGSVESVDAMIKTLEEIEVKHGFWIWAFDKRHEPKKGYPYQPMPKGQFQEDGRYVLVHPKELVKITNPDDKYLRVKDLRKKAGL